MVALCFVAFMPASRAIAGEDSSRNLIGDVIKGTVGLVVDGVSALGKTIMEADSKSGRISNFVIGKEIAVYKLNKNFQILVSDGTYKKKDALVFSTLDEKNKIAYYVGYEKHLPEDVQAINDFNKMSDLEKKKFIKDSFLKYAKFDIGDIDPEPVAAAAQQATNNSSSIQPASEQANKSETVSTQKLRELKKLKDEDLLTDKEYDQKRKAIVDAM
jgi:hypothetical protein